MNIDKIIRREKRYNYLDNVQASLSEFGLTLTDLKTYKRVGRSNGGDADTIFKQNFGKDCKLPDHRNVCLCGHQIVEQCCLCPESNDVNDILVVGNRCIKTWGFDPAIRGKLENKIKCDLCGSLVNKKGIAKHKKTGKCRNNSDTSSTQSRNLWICVKLKEFQYITTKNIGCVDKFK